MAGKVAKPTALAWNQIRPASIVLVSGTNGYLADRSIKRLRDFLHAEDPALEISDLDASGYTRGALLTVASPSLFGEARLVRVDSVEKCSDDFLEDALSYLDEPAEGATIVLRHAGGVRGKKLLDAIRASASAIEVACPELKKDQERLEFAQAEFVAMGRRATASAVRQLVTAFGDDLAELASACAQLVADSSGDIDDALVKKYYGGRAETTAFTVVDLALAGRQAEAIIALRHALDSGADPVPIVAAFAMKVRGMAKVMGRREPAAQLAGPLGMAPWQIDRAKRDLAGWDDDGLGRMIRAIAAADVAVKGGSRDTVYPLERLTVLLANKGY
ncbi:MAG TPA: DNA polymerase III subunit delta [Microbacteriaceae bacterium]|nr:DNA polymerase III subunit delta [Microbacteriaceae bacterium]